MLDADDAVMQSAREQNERVMGAEGLNWPKCGAMGQNWPKYWSEHWGKSNIWPKKEEKGQNRPNIGPKLKMANENEEEDHN